MKKELLEAAVSVAPSERQINWSEVEFSALLSFGMNTFTDSEIGSGGENPEQFNPTNLNIRRWVKIIRAAGMRGVIFTAKHFDGFCNWPSAFTQHSVKNSPWLDGNGDLVKEVADACREFDMKFGIYIAAWDRHETSYGSDEYNTFFKNQLRELLTNYGELFCVWLDDTCREDKNGRHQAFDWDGCYELIRELQPEAAIAGRGPDVRWCGNNIGVCRSSEWSVVPYFYSDTERKALSGKEGVKAPPKAINMALPDLGSRAVIKKGYPMIWYPAEVNVPLRKGWFYHLDDEYSVKPLSKIVEFYYNSVGANASLLLGLCPKPDGSFAEDDLNNLISLGAQLKIDFKEDLAQESEMTASCCLDNAHEPQNVLLDDSEKFWHSGFEQKEPWLMIDLGDDYDIDKVVLKEHIKTGQQIEKFSLYGEIDGKWKKLSEGTVIGRKRICRFNEIRVQRIKLVIEKTRLFAAIEKFEAY